MFTIEITYETGNSFNSCTEVDLIGACWKDINKVAAALQEIKKHNKYFDDKNYKNGYSDFKKNKKYEELTEHSIKLKDDDDNDIIINAFWRGYFERLLAVKIVVDDPNNEFSLDFY